MRPENYFTSWRLFQARLHVDKANGLKRPGYTGMVNYVVWDFCRVSSQTGPSRSSAEAAAFHKRKIVLERSGTGGKLVDLRYDYPNLKATG